MSDIEKKLFSHFLSYPCGDKVICHECKVKEINKQVEQLNNIADK